MKRNKFIGFLLAIITVFGVILSGGLHAAAIDMQSETDIAFKRAKAATYKVTVEYYSEYDGKNHVVGEYTVKHGGTVPTPKITIPDGYHIAIYGWIYNGEDSFGNFMAGPWDFSDKVYADMTISTSIYRYCTVTFDTLGGCKAPAPVKVPKYDMLRNHIDKLPTGESKDGYCLEAWYYDPEYTRPVTMERDSMHEDVTVYAKWSQLHATATDLPVEVEKPAIKVKLNSNNKPVISWPKVAGATKYEVKRAINGGTYSKLVTTNNNTVTHTGAVTGNSYTYIVRAINSSGKYSAYSNAVTVKPIDGPPSIPYPYTYLNADGKPVISWGAVDGAEKYEVYRSVNGGVYSKLILTSKTSVTHTGAVAGNTYSYIVRAVGYNGEYGDFGGTQSITPTSKEPSAPGIKVNLNEAGKPVISWTATNGASKYEVYRSVNGGAYARLILTSKTSVTHTGAAAGNTYSYKVRAVSADGKYSEYSAVKTVAMAPKAPTVTVELNASGKPVISWDAVSGAAKYEVYRSVNGGEYARLILTSKTSITHTGAVAGNTYSYKVRAVTASGTYGEYCAVISTSI